MTTTDTVRDGADGTTPLFKREAGWQVFMMLRTVFIVAPLLFGIDKFFNLMVEWPVYLAPIVTDVIPVTAQQFMYVVGVIEIVAAVCVFLFPRFGSRARRGLAGRHHPEPADSRQWLRCRAA